MYIYTHTYKYIYIYIYVNVNIHMYIYIYIYQHTYIYIYIYVAAGEVAVQRLPAQGDRRAEQLRLDVADLLFCYLFGFLYLFDTYVYIHIYIYTYIMACVFIYICMCLIICVFNYLLICLYHLDVADGELLARLHRAVRDEHCEVADREPRIGWANNHFNNLHFRRMFETKKNT